MDKFVLLKSSKTIMANVNETVIFITWQPPAFLALLYSEDGKTYPQT